MKYHYLLPFIAIGAFTGCATAPTELKDVEAISYADTVYLKQEDVFSAFNAYETKINNRVNRLEYQVNELESRLENMATSADNNSTVEIVDGSRKQWACTLTHSEKRFMAQSLNKAAATFNVINKCLAGGVDDFYCQERDVVCSDE
ncbi:hypothetical protein [Gynuella sunshinyii]|uniref:Uncharacterized protein n=1 Tax=Gynuella sunshinyii YC6258 TaxID=1445510 RepID=A0A0C5VBY1_9GAMM|nr:hypothetical protein [Gynuella sunshinyii]AJQ96850.1 hypothetical Protein YC6258_04818 [Gynuella sunshinyii YC6258]